MTQQTAQDAKPAADDARSSAGTVTYDEKKKLSELQSIILQKGDLARERILTEARAEAEKWTHEQTLQMNAMAVEIKADAEKRAREITSRQMAEAESARDKDRLRLQSDLIRSALLGFQEALVALAERPDYDAILTGLAAEICGRFPKSQAASHRRVKMRLRADDAPHGEAVARALRSRFPEIDVVFDAEPTPIIGGVLLYSEEEKWQVVADWKSKAEDMADDVAKAVLAEL
jgi:V/A-type H+-transporting ATPase subunit E